MAAILAIRSRQGGTFVPEEGVDLVEDEELPDQEDCIKSGMLSRKSQGARGHWAPRFVILTSSELTFCKVSDEGRRSRLDWVPLDEIVSVNAKEYKEAENDDGVLALDAGASMRDVNGLKRASIRHVDMDDDEDDKFSFLIQVCTCGAGTAPRITTRRRELAF
jgi:hypothetical protein